MNATANHHTLSRFAVLALLVYVAGCSGNPAATYPVRGTVRLDGKPMARGTVLFESIPAETDGERFTARATITGDGTYRLSTFGEYDGAVAGRHRAVVLASSVNPENTGGTPEPVLPVKYASTRASQLEYEVKPETNTIDIELSTR